jgi:hypothetical protein
MPCSSQPCLDGWRWPSAFRGVLLHRSAHVRGLEDPPAGAAVQMGQPQCPIRTMQRPAASCCTSEGKKRDSQLGKGRPCGRKRGLFSRPRRGQGAKTELAQEPQDPGPPREEASCGNPSFARDKRWFWITSIGHSNNVPVTNADQKPERQGAKGRVAEILDLSGSSRPYEECTDVRIPGDVKTPSFKAE